MFGTFEQPPRTNVVGANVGPVRVAFSEGVPPGSTASLAWAPPDAAAVDAAADAGLVLQGNLVAQVDARGRATFPVVTVAGGATPGSRLRLLASAAGGAASAVSPPFAAVRGLELADVVRHPLSRQVDFVAAVGGAAAGLPVEARSAGQVVTAATDDQGRAHFRGVPVPPGPSTVRVSVGNLHAPLAVRVGRVPVEIRAEPPTLHARVGEPLNGEQGLRAVLVDELQQPAAAVGGGVASVVVRDAAGRGLGSADVHPESGVATVRGLSLDSPGRQVLTLTSEAVPGRSGAVTVHVQPALRASADLRAGGMVDPPAEGAERLLREWAGKVLGGRPEDVLLSRFEASMRRGLAARVTLLPDGEGRLRPPLSRLADMRRRAQDGELPPLPSALYGGDAQAARQAAAGSVQVDEPYREVEVAAGGPGGGGPSGGGPGGGGPGAAAAGVALRVDGPGSVWATRPFSLTVRFVHPTYAHRDVEVAEGELSASVVGQPPEQQLTASTVQVRRASVATLGPLRLSRPGRAVVVRLTLRLPGGGAAVADTEPFQVTPGRYHHAWCDEFPNLCPSGGPEAPTPTAPPSAAPSLPSAPASTAAPAPTAPPPLRVGEPSQLESVVSNCLPLLDDLTKVEGGRLDKPSEEHVRLCRLTLTSLPAAFEGVACSPDDTHRCAAVQQAAQALDRLAPQLTRAGRAVRDCALRSCRPDQKSSMLQAERRLGGGGSCDGGSAPLRRAAYESGFAVPAAALALSAFTVWCFSVQQRGVVPAPAGIRRPQPVQQQQAVLPPRALNARPAVM